MRIRKVAFTLSAALIVSACASTGTWRALQIDGTSEAAFAQSVSTLENTLPHARSQMFVMALIDIELQQRVAAGSDDAFTFDQYMLRLDGLGYDEVIALADETGPSIMRQYMAGRGPVVSNDANQSLSQPPMNTRQYTWLGGQPFPAPGTTNWPAGSDERGRAVIVR